MESLQKPLGKSGDAQNGFLSSARRATYGPSTQAPQHCSLHLLGSGALQIPSRPGEQRYPAKWRLLGYCRLVHIGKKQPGFLVHCWCQTATLECKHGKSNIWLWRVFRTLPDSCEISAASSTHTLRVHTHKSDNNLPIPDQPQPAIPALPACLSVSRSYFCQCTHSPTLSGKKCP